MTKVECLFDGEYRTEYAYDINDFPYDDIGNEFIPATFDIETTTIHDSMNDRYESYMYIWQMCIEGKVIFGRSWTEWSEFLEKLENIYEHLIIYVHNLSYEFEFIRDFIVITDIFATDKRKVLKCNNDVFEFRCSYRLSNMNLNKFIEDTPNTHHNKGVDDLNYRIIRTPSTELTPREYGYCYNDVMGLYEAINELLKEDTLKTIPLTSTGYVRRDCRKAMRSNKKNRKQFRCIRLNQKLLQLCRDCFRGGNTASNRLLTDVVLDDVSSYDISSSYPYAMLLPMYPVGTFHPFSVKTHEELKYILDKYCVISNFMFTGLKLKKDVSIPYLPYAKCKYIKDSLCYNGRVLECSSCVIALTNIDYEIITSQYDFDEVLVKDTFVATRGYLPLELRNQILKYFYDKSTLKGVHGKEYEYMQAKARLNAIYGMCVSNIIHTEITLVNGEWVETTGDVEKKINDYYESWNSFLSYKWGVFVTAVARRRLQQAIDLVGMDVVYCDTDSVKYINQHDDIFTKLNEDVVQYCQKHSIRNSVEYNHKVYMLGIWDREQPYDQFKTLGAKKYAYMQNGHIGITVAGLSKKLGAKELEKEGLKGFVDGRTFINSGRTVAYYNNADQHYITVNGERILTGSNIAIVDTTYTLGITDTMLDIITDTRRIYYGRDC